MYILDTMVIPHIPQETTEMSLPIVLFMKSLLLSPWLEIKSLTLKKYFQQPGSPRGALFVCVGWTLNMFLITGLMKRLNRSNLTP